MSWHYLENQFDNVTRTSFRKMLTITNDHYAKLQAQQADPDILALLTRTTPVHDAFLNGYSGWKGELGAYKGATQLIDQLLETLSSTSGRQWDTAIMVQYDKGTVEHTALLPNGHQPFQTGTMDERIAAVKTLSDALLAHAPLAALQVTVSGFHTQLKDARDAQQGKEQLSGQLSTDLETARKAIALMQYRNLAMLMDKFGDQPEQVLNYFELALLQTHSSGTEPSSEEFSGTVDPLSTVNITSNIPADADIIMSNTGVVTLQFCGEVDGTTACTIGNEVLPGTVKEGKGIDLGPFMNVTNNDPSQSGSYNVEVIQGV